MLPLISHLVFRSDHLLFALFGMQCAHAGTLRVFLLPSYMPQNGAKPTRGQQVTVHCTGYGKNRDLNEKFWSTKDPGQEPFTFAVGLGQVIKGQCSFQFPIKMMQAFDLTCTVGNVLASTS